MNRIITLFLLVFVAISFSNSQVNRPSTDYIGLAGSKIKATDANITGHAVDKTSGEHLSFISVSLKGTTVGAATDATGHFYLRNLPEGNFTIVASAVGYKSIEKNIKLISGKTLELNFEMQEDVIMLDNVVVSANRNQTKRSETSNIVNVLSSKLFETTNSVCLAQGLNFQPGLRVENNCQNCGFQQVRINGLEGQYSQILIDSRPIFSALAGVYGIEQIPVNMIERVEIVRGGGSALFGSNAIAGTINIITKEPLNNSLTVSNNTLFIAGSKSDMNTNFNAALVSDDYKTGISIFGSTRQRDGWDANGDEFTEIGLLNARNIGLRSYFKTGMQSKLTFEYHTLGEFRRGGNRLNLPAHQADIAEQTNHNFNSGSLKFDFFTPDNKHRFNAYTAAQHTDRDSYYGAGQDPNAYGETRDIAFVAGGQYALAMNNCLFLPADLTVGAEYSFNKLVDKQLSYNRIIDQLVNTKSLFVQNEWKNRYLSLLLGLRFDKHNLIPKPIYSPRINVRYKPFDWVNLRLSYASGFRAPQAFDEDLHITAVGGEMQVIVPNPLVELRPEKSNSYSFSADFTKQFEKVQTNFMVEGFFTDISNVFYLDENGVDAEGNTLLVRRNGLGAVVKGINFEAKIVPSTKINFQGGFTVQQSLYKKAQTWSSNPNLAPTRQMFRSPNNYGYLILSYLPTKALTLSANGTYTGRMYMQHYGVDITDDVEVLTPDFFDLSCKVAYDIKTSASTKLQLNAGVQNIFNSYQTDFDQGVTRDAGYIYGPSLPRSYFVGLKFYM